MTQTYSVTQQVIYLDLPLCPPNSYHTFILLVFLPLSVSMFSVSFVCGGSILCKTWLIPPKKTKRQKKNQQKAIYSVQIQESNQTLILSDLLNPVYGDEGQRFWPLITHTHTHGHTHMEHTHTHTQTLLPASLTIELVLRRNHKIGVIRERGTTAKPHSP